MDQHRDWMAWQVLVVSLPSSFSLGSMKLPQFFFFFLRIWEDVKRLRRLGR